MIKGFNELKKVMEKSAVTLKMKSGESKILRLLVPSEEISSAYEHVIQINGGWRTIECLGRKECPLCKSGLTASLKAYIPVLDKTEGKVKIFKASKDVVKSLIAFESEEEYKDLTKFDLKCIRQGEGLNTKYTFIIKEKTNEDLSKYREAIPDIHSFLETLTKEEIQALLNEAHTSSTVNEPSNNSNDETNYPF